MPTILRSAKRLELGRRYVGDRHIRDFRTAPLPRARPGARAAGNDRHDGLCARPRFAPPLAPSCAACACRGRYGAPRHALVGRRYFDSNFGDEPLEAGFDDWHWSRAHLKQDVAVLYEGRRRGGAPFDLALKFDRRAAGTTSRRRRASNCRAPVGWSSARRAPIPALRYESPRPGSTRPSTHALRSTRGCSGRMSARCTRACRSGGSAHRSSSRCSPTACPALSGEGLSDDAVAAASFFALVARDLAVDRNELPHAEDRHRQADDQHVHQAEIVRVHHASPAKPAMIAATSVGRSSCAR